MDEIERKGSDDQGDSQTKRAFLKTVGTGLGVAGLAAMMGGQAFAQSEKAGKYIIVISHGGDDPNRAILALLLAQTAAEKGWGKVHVWMTLGGVELANKKKTDKIESPVYKKFGNAQEIMNKIKAKGAWFGMCPPCADYFGSMGGDKHDFVELAGADWLMKNMQDAWVAWL
jgi:predicted peroxiredoxin